MSPSVAHAQTHLKLDRSKSLGRRADQLFPGGINSNNYYVPSLAGPLFIERADGAYLQDVDGNKYIDFWPSHSALLVGHNHPAVQKAIADQLAKGSNFGLFSPNQVDLAERLKQRFPTMERLFFTDSNTRATAYAVRLARAFTKRPLIAKLQGAYHGTVDTLYIGMQKIYGEKIGAKVVRAGVAPHLADDITLIQWNDVEQTKKVFETSGDQIAGLIIEPVLGDGVIPPTPDFLKILRELCNKHGTLLIYDEAVTCGMSAGGAQQFYGVQPDITVVGKAMGGGLPIAAVGASESIMSLTEIRGGLPEVPISMTYAGHPLAAAAGVAQLELLTQSAYSHMSRLAEKFAEGGKSIAATQGVPMSITTASHLFHVHWNKNPVRTWYDQLKDDEDVKAFIQGQMLEDGIYIGSKGRACMCLAHTDAHVDQLIESLEKAVKAVKKVPAFAKSLS